MWQPGGGFGVSAAGESWLIPGWSFHTKPLSARPGNGVTACWDPWLSWDHEGPCLGLGKPSTCSGLGKNPGLCLCQVFCFCCAPESLNPTPVLQD